MHDINPLGPMLHLKELERQAAPKLRQLRSSQRVPNVTTLSAAIIALLGRLRVVGFHWHAATHS